MVADNNRKLYDYDDVEIVIGNERQLLAGR